MELIPYLLTQTKLNRAECEAIDNAFTRKTFAKGTILTQPDNHHQNVYFIEKGLLRAFYNLDGKDITHYFFNESNFLVSFESVFFNRPHPYGKQALEKTDLRIIPYSKLDELCNCIPAFRDYRLQVSLQVVSMLSDKILALQFQSTEQRYKNLLDKFPGILQRAPLGHIASYLGITQQTLSVIRAGK
ncbi:Crp/Fnr family transcriptional regulator [Sphingobacterium athyrii]|uniref:Crp/Fnr family transcriptional regulator n=1 Tax=Sphingobacterium athyrii TaxID=2152717 RepID=A0A363P0G8_9SPHI|nr:Crp/Fnr family transcriptional regulator [Sphingobacterium athyrii]PUV26438.1 Crp/Fnr family transcriptional regulator [Sphingobacterium athyrii]